MKYIRAVLALFIVLAAGTIDGTCTESIAAAMDYLLSCQNEDGGFGANKESDSDIKDTSLAVIALASTGKNLSEFATKKGDPLTYLLERHEELDNLSNVEAQIGRYVVALASAGLNPRDANGKNYVQTLKSFIHSDGEVGMKNYIWDDAWVIMALTACNESKSDEVNRAVDRLKALQTAKGGWSWSGGSSGEDPDTSGIVLCALLDSGEENSSDVVKKGLQYLSSEQNNDGGFSSLGSNAATDGWAIMAIRAAGQNPAEWRVGSNDPIGHLLSLQKEDGAVWWKSDSEGMSFEWTANTILALAGGRNPPAIF